MGWVWCECAGGAIHRRSCVMGSALTCALFHGHSTHMQSRIRCLYEHIQILKIGAQTATTCLAGEAARLMYVGQPYPIAVRVG